jgi:DNA repair protein RecN (Recombination protein N)
MLARALDPRHRPDRTARHRLRPGLAVLTGETGAGKSILLDAFALALGAAATRAWCATAPSRARSPRCSTCPRAIRRALLSENGIDDRRRDDPAPRAACRRPHPRLRQRPAGQRAGAESARRALVEIHGQHDERALVDASTHRRCSTPSPAREGRARARALWDARARREEAVDEHRAGMERAAREADYLRHAATS